MAIANAADSNAYIHQNGTTWGLASVLTPTYPTYCFWYYSAQNATYAGNHRHLLNANYPISSATAVGGFQLFIGLATGIVYWAVRNAANTATVNVTGAGAVITPSTWHHMLVTWTGTHYQIYLNNSLYAEVASTAGVGCGATAIFRIMAQKGQMFDVRAYSYSLSEAERTEVYNRKGLDSLFAGMIFRAGIKDGYAGTNMSGGTFYDHSISKLTGTGVSTNTTIASDPFPTVKSHLLAA